MYEYYDYVYLCKQLGCNECNHPDCDNTELINENNDKGNIDE